MSNFMNMQLALAGVCQAALLVKTLARTGKCDQDAFEASLESITITDPDETIDIYGNLKNLHLGIETLSSQLGHSSKPKDSEITRYVADILGLERKLMRNPQNMSDLAKRIDNIKRLKLHSSLFETQMMSNLASIYKDVISPLGSKIQVAGNPTILKQAGVQDKVRAILLAGIRSAVLWRQLGGKRRNIIFQRKKILKVVDLLQQRLNDQF
ncbi:high frequency lysogenization protein HflD [Paraneptunicella aestuarii]|uniref:high frequency lysogenization protein HflD n=1 Tax=Paraneptunicella aestuarii TaxID=2831148 RepID=UPI001E2E9A40|nr:high frequency lysogenization protein HflD [Paraneptunicella aestuarii]UAA40477.1 high frequency lysogenization protein HflD [Paraneptunicella aestuarii]